MIVIGILVVVVMLLVWQISRSTRKHASVQPRGSIRTYHVVGGFANKDAAAELLDNTNKVLIRFLRGLKYKYHIDETDDLQVAHASEHKAIMQAPGDLYAMVNYLLDNYNPDVFYENDPRYTKDTSYTLDKGRAMYICLRNKDDPTRLVDNGTLLFTMLHEMAHIANYRGWGHGQDFWACFKWLLHEAQLAGIYTPVDYAKYPTDFCGLTINWNPLHDSAVPQLWGD